MFALAAIARGYVTWLPGARAKDSGPVEWWRVVAVYPASKRLVSGAAPAWEWTVRAGSGKEACEVVQATWCMAHIGKNFVWSATEEKPEFIPASPE